MVFLQFGNSLIKHYLKIQGLLDRVFSYEQIWLYSMW